MNQQRMKIIKQQLLNISRPAWCWEFTFFKCEDKFGLGKRISPRIVHRFIPCKSNCFLFKFPCGNAFTVIDLSCRFSPARFFFLHGFRDRLLEVRCVSFVRYSLWHKNHPICQTVYHMSDKWGAVHTNVIPKLWVKTCILRSERASACRCSPQSR